MDQSTKLNGQLRHHFTTVHEMSKLDKMFKPAQKQSSLYLPPTLSDIDLRRVYGDLLNEHDYDMPNSNYSKPNTASNIVSVVFVRHGQSAMNKEGVF